MRTQHRGRGYAAWVAALALAGVVAGCTSLDKLTAKKDENPFLEEWKKRAAEARGSSPEATVRQVELPDREELLAAKPKEVLPEEENVKPLPSQKIEEFTMRDAEVSVVLRSLAKIAGVNLLLSEDVKGNVSIELRDVPWDQAFNGILKTQNLRFQWEGDILRVLTFEDLRNELEAQKVTQERLQIAEEARQTEPLLMRTVNINYADATELRKTLEDVLVRRSTDLYTADGKAAGQESTLRGSVLLDKGNSVLILHAVREDLAKMIELIEALDRPTAQIVIEVQIVEATSAAARELGVEWGGLYKFGDNWITPGANTNDSILGLPLDPSAAGAIDPITGSVVNLPASEVASGGLNLGFMHYKEGERMLYAQLQAMERDSKLNILSSPSVTTLDNLEAMIESGREVPYETSDEEGDREVEWKEAVLRLKVTPHVIDGKLVKLAIDVQKDELDFNNAVTNTSAGGTYPLVITKKANTNLILHDGETTVIGGLSKQNNAEGERGVPYLKDIPWLGYLFRSHRNVSEMDELLIFMTPHLLPPRSAQATGI